MTETPCLDCKAAPATVGRFCAECVERTAAEECVKAGMPAQGRDPAEVRAEIRLRRAAAALLLGRLTRDEQRQADAMAAVLRECYQRPGLTPPGALVPPLLNLATYLADEPTPPGPPLPPPPPNVVRMEPVRWRSEFVEQLREAATLAEAEAELTDDAELIRDCHATAAAAGSWPGRLTGNADVEADGWARVETLAERHHAAAHGLLLGPVLGLLNDRVGGPARDYLVDRLRTEVMLFAGAVPDTLAALDLDADGLDLDDEEGTR